MAPACIVIGDVPLPRSSGTKISTASSVRAGICRSTGSLSSIAPAGMRNDEAPLTVSLRSDEVTMSKSLSWSASDAPPMVTGAVPNVFAKTTRARVPAIDVRTI
ncbi:MAG: hypothetical protein DMF87_15405 [Acidobacteria bacterium]|nr:MAG: hypothetical protein DMF87_15405 [Acidobacteriota bacterium]